MRVHRNLAAAVGFAAVACGARDTVSDDGVTVTLRRVSCADCRIVSDSVAFIPATSDAPLRLPPARDSRGRYFTRPADRTPVLVFSPEGQQVASIALPVSGRDSVVHIRDVHVLPGDTILVIDGKSAQVLAPDLTPARQVDFASGAQWLTSGLVSTLANPLNTVLPDGRVLSAGLHSFATLTSTGTAGQTVRLQGIDSAPCLYCSKRIFRSAVASGLTWSSAPNVYVVELHDEAGRMLTRFVRDVPWFREWRGMPKDTGIAVMTAFLARPFFMGAREGSDGLLWTHSIVMNANNPVDDSYAEAFAGFANDGVVDATTAHNVALRMERHFESRIEVIDLATKRLLASTTFPRHTLPMQGDYSAQWVAESGREGWKIVRFRVEEVRSEK